MISDTEISERIHENCDYFRVCLGKNGGRCVYVHGSYRRNVDRDDDTEAAALLEILGTVERAYGGSERCC